MAKKKTKKEIVTSQQRKEIFYNIVNSLISGALVFLGTIVGADFKFTAEGVCVALGVALIVCLTKFKSYWDGESGEYSKNFLNFIP
jgi:hypothetical protein